MRLTCGLLMGSTTILRLAGTGGKRDRHGHFILMAGMVMLPKRRGHVRTNFYDPKAPHGPSDTGRGRARLDLVRRVYRFGRGDSGASHGRHPGIGDFVGFPPRYL